MANAIFIRQLRAEDIPSVVACFPDMPAEDVAERLEDELRAQAEGRGFTLVAEVEGSVAAALTFEPNGPAGWVQNVATLPAFQRRGLAQALLERVIAEAPRFGVERLALHVKSSNSRAIRAYRRAGFRCVGEDGMRGEQLRYERALKKRARLETRPTKPTV